MTDSYTAYFVPAANESERGPGVLVLHSWWGLSPTVKGLCERLADEGYCALAPNFFGEVALTQDRAKELLDKAEPNEMADLVLSSMYALRSYTDEPNEPIAIIGYAMGGSLGLWASTRQSDDVTAVVSIYGTQDIDFSESQSDYLLISASEDDIAVEDEMNYTQALISLGDNYVETITATDTQHGFMEKLDPNFNERATEQQISNILEFLKKHYRTT